MKTTSIDIAGLLPSRDYRGPLRDRLRREAIEHRRSRCLMLGPAMRLQFEDLATVRHQVQEVLRAERADDAETVRQTIANFAHLLPNGSHWRATLFIELRERRERELPALSAAAHRLYACCAGAERVGAEANEDLPDRHRGRPSAVHFLRFPLGAPLRARLDRGHPLTIGCAHPAYAWQRAVPATLARILRDELRADETAAP